MKQNQGVNFLKGLLILSVLYLHVITFIIGVKNANEIMMYFYSLFSVTVPTFFLISGFFFAKSRNNEKNLKKLIVLYIFFAIITAIITNLFYTPIAPLSLLIKKYFILGYYTGYIWFLKYLIIFQMIAYIFITGKNKKYKFFFVMYFICSLVVFEVSKDKLNPYFVELVPFLIGMVLSKTDIKISPYWAVTALLLPIFLHGKYNIESQYTTLFAGILFLSFWNVKLENDPIKFISKNTAEMLFLHYFVINTISYYFLKYFTNQNVIFIYIVVVFATLMLLFLYKKVETLFLKMRSSL